MFVVKDNILEVGVRPFLEISHFASNQIFRILKGEEYIHFGDMGSFYSSIYVETDFWEWSGEYWQRVVVVSPSIHVLDYRE